MPTPSGVNYLLQFLIVSSNSPIIGIQESKVDVLCCAKRPKVERSLMSLYLYLSIGISVFRVTPYIIYMLPPILSEQV